MNSKTSEPTNDQPSAPAAIDANEATEYFKSDVEVEIDEAHSREVDRCIGELRRAQECQRALEIACDDKSENAAIKAAVLFILGSRGMDQLFVIRQLTNDPTWGMTAEQLDQYVNTHESLL